MLLLYYLFLQAEWMSSQMDVRRARAPNEDEELEAVKEEVDGVSLTAFGHSKHAQKKTLFHKFQKWQNHFNMLHVR